MPIAIAGVSAAVRVRTRRTASGIRTTVTVDHRIPASASERAARWRISTLPLRLPSTHFESAAEVNARSADGRAIACIDLETNTTTAAVAYHLDEGKSLPVLLVAMATRIDDPWVEVSRGCVPILKAYLHEVSRKLGRRGALGVFVASARTVVLYERAFGFRRAAVPAAWRRSSAGQTYLEQLVSAV